MQEVFERIIEKLAMEGDIANDKIMEQESENDAAYYDGYEDGCTKGMEIVRQAAAGYDNSWIPQEKKMSESVDYNVLFAKLQKNVMLKIAVMLLPILL